MFTQRLIHLTLTSITTLALCYSATGGELLPTLMLAMPLGVVFAASGFVGGLLAQCGSLAGVTGLYALMNLLSENSSIPPLMTYITVSLTSIALAIGWRHSSPGFFASWAPRSSPLAVVPPLIALISGYLVVQWTRYSDLEFLNALGGSEDNAAWISGTRTFLAGEMTTQFLAHPTAKSPVTGTTLGFVSDVYWIAQSDTPGHL